MKIEINKESCIGCGICANLCSECFALNDEGKAEVIKSEGCSGDCNRDEIITSCPVGAISISD